MSDLLFRGSDGTALHATILGADAAVRAGDRPIIVLMHGGGPDHRSLLPLGRRLADLCTVVLPDVRGYGRSVCRDPTRHTWAQYADDVAALLDDLGARRGTVGGTGLGSTIALRTAAAHPERVSALVLISVEDIEDDEAKEAEIELMDAFAERVRTRSISAGWEPILPALAPVIGALVRDAIPRSDPESIAAAAAIGRDRSFRSVDELAAITAPALVIPGMDPRHPPALAEAVARLLPRGRLAPIGLTPNLSSADDLARAFAPAIRDFLMDEVTEGVLTRSPIPPSRPEPMNHVPKAERASDLVRAYFAAYETGDRDAIEAVLDDGFTFTSPQDDRIDRETYLARCWPGSEKIRAVRIRQLFAEGGEALVRYRCELTSGATYRGTEYFLTDGERIQEVDAYFGNDPAYLHSIFAEAGPSAATHPSTGAAS
jgi:3-oxoadipate enol-lactonase